MLKILISLPRYGVWKSNWLETVMKRQGNFQLSNIFQLMDHQTGSVDYQFKCTDQ